MRKLNTLLEDYINLERGVIDLLKSNILKSKINSKFISGKCLPLNQNNHIELLIKTKEKSKFLNGKILDVNTYNYTELVLIDNDLIFFDKKGRTHELFEKYNLDDLIVLLMNYDKLFNKKYK